VLAFPLSFGPQGVWYGLALGLCTVAILLLLRLRSTLAKGGFRVVSSHG
jgi:Na+-driven multidrug efflux pump